MFDFLLYYLAALFAGALVITGWYAITRGEWKTCPDGSKIYVGKIFKGWQKFWEKEKGKNTVYYAGDELKKMMLLIESLLGLSTADNAKYRYWFDPDGSGRVFVTDETLKHLDERAFLVEVQNEVSIHLIHSLSSGYNSSMMISKDFTEYVFPEWVRSPVASCIYCHSSIYGTIMWALLSFLNWRFFELPPPVIIYFIMWPLYCFSLSFVLPWLNKKI